MDMDYYKSYTFQICLNAALGALYFGYNMGVFNPLQDFIKTNIYPDISENVLYLMTSFLPAGGALGAFLSG